VCISKAATFNKLYTLCASATLPQSIYIVHNIFIVHSILYMIYCTPCVHAQHYLDQYWGRKQAVTYVQYCPEQKTISIRTHLAYQVVLNALYAVCRRGVRTHLAYQVVLNALYAVCQRGVRTHLAYQVVLNALYAVRRRGEAVSTELRLRRGI